METILKDTHLSEDALEQYVEGRLSSQDVSRASEHLLECDTCYGRYEHEVEVLRRLRLARQNPAPEPASKMPPFWSHFRAFSAPVIVALATVVLAVLLVPRLNVFNSSPVVAELTAFRGSGAITAPANRNLVLRLDTTGIPAAPSLRVEIADSGGTSVWNGTAAASNSRVEVAVNQHLTAGQYWVRVYAAGSAEVLREYSLSLQ